MNISALKMLLVDDLRGLWEAHRRSIERLEDFPFTALVPRVRAAHDEFLRETRAQVTELEGMFERLGCPSTGGTCGGVRGLLDELDTVAARESGAYPPIHGDSRFVAVLWKLLQYRMAACRVAIVTAHVLESWGIEERLKAAWERDRSLERVLSELMVQVLRLVCADTPDEASRAVEALA
jgi:ferritin-like metal-binding protein YciE